MRFNHLLLALAVLLPATAEASYVRIWRGHQKAGLSDAAFLRGMNHALLPATGELALGAAKLESYLPVVLPPDLEARGLPAEVALLSYESEAGYRAYRATAEGIHYGDMHWDLFEKTTSASLVPVAYAGSLAFDQAYEVVGGDPTWSSGVAKFHVLERGAGESDAAYLARLATRLTAVQATKPLSYYLLVSNAYALEYVNDDTDGDGSDQLASSSSFAVTLPESKVLTLGSGVRYPVREDGANAGVRDIWTHHINAWNARDLDEIMLDYDEGSVVIRGDEIYRGLGEIRSVFADLFARFAHVTVGSVDRVVQTSNVVYITWRATAKLADGTELSSQQGTDTFVILDGKIDTQTITAAPAFWTFAP